MSRVKHSSNFRTRVVIEALKEVQTASELAQKFKIHPSQISTWKREFLSKASEMFDKGKKNIKIEAALEKERLLKIIGQQKVELDFLKNALRQ